MSRLTDSILNQGFSNWIRDKLLCVDKDKLKGKSGYIVTFNTGQTDIVLCAPSGKYVWQKVGYAKSAMRLSYSVESQFQKLLGVTRYGDYLSRAEKDQIWGFFWTKLEIKKIGGESIREAIDLIKSGNIAQALKILESLL